MDYIPVESSSLSAVCYVPEEEALYVTFLKGGEYRYANVNSAVYDALMSGGSVGKFFAANIQWSFPYERIG